MAELEIHTEVEGADSFGKKIGVLTAVIAVVLGVVTIISHRAHTDAVLLKSQANDKWSFYQAKKIKFHSLELGEDLMRALGAKGEEAEKALERYGKEKQRYTKDSDTAQEDARKTDEAAEHVEAQALRFDFGEGLLEIGMVLASLYFISRSKLFPVIGVISALLGVAAAVSGYFV
jgi:Domain of unknown function (DUF4337)